MFKHNFDGISESYKYIRDIESELMIFKEMNKFIHRNNRIIKETPNSHMRRIADISITLAPFN